MRPSTPQESPPRGRDVTMPPKLKRKRLIFEPKIALRNRMNRFAPAAYVRNQRKKSVNCVESLRYSPRRGMDRRIDRACTSSAHTCTKMPNNGAFLNHCRLLDIRRNYLALTDLRDWTSSWRAAFHRLAGFLRPPPDTMLSTPRNCSPERVLHAGCVSGAVALQGIAAALPVSHPEGSASDCSHPLKFVSAVPNVTLRCRLGCPPFLA